MKAKKSLILLVMIVVAITLSSCDSDSSEEAAQEERKHKIAEEVQELCSKHNAVKDWKQRIGKKDFGEHIYTIEIEDALIGTDGRPILLTASIHDIVRESDKYLVYFSRGSILSFFLASASDLDFLLSFDVHFVLECTADQVKEIIHNPAAMLDYYAVIAQISKVEKVRFKLEGKYGSNEDVTVNLETADVFIAKGKCLDLLFVSDESTLDKNKKKQDPLGIR